MADIDRPDRSPLRVLSLFAGIGGIDLGLEAKGCKLVAYSEVDPYASAVLAERFPDAVNLGDITLIDWEQVNRDHGPFDIISGGFPCQDISTAGKGAGIAEGTRSGLWSCYADAVRVLRPRGVLVENVAALLARGIDRVLGDLAACGFDAEWDCVPAAAVGAPHLRDRVFIVAYRTDTRAGGGDAGSIEHEGGRDAQRGPEAECIRAFAGADADGERRGTGRAGRVAALDEVRKASGSTGADADSDRVRLEPVAVAGRSGQAEPRGHREDAADADRSGRVEQRWPAPVPAQLATAERGGWWLAEPQVGRVADGVPRRVDRLRCLGNAVVPAVAEHVAGILIDRMEAA